MGRLISALLLLALAGACTPDVQLEPTPIPGVSEGVTGEIGVQDQTSDGTRVMVTSVTITGSPGWLVVHRDANGQPGQVVGHTPVPEGHSTDVVVEFTSRQSSGTFWPMVHVDTGTVGRFEFPHPGDRSIDAPVSVDGELVTERLQLTVQSATASPGAG